MIDRAPLPAPVEATEADGIEHVKQIDSTPIGANVPSKVATYADIHDELRRIFALPPKPAHSDAGQEISLATRANSVARPATEPAR